MGRGREGWREREGGGGKHSHQGELSPRGLSGCRGCCGIGRRRLSLQERAGEEASRNLVGWLHRPSLAFRVLSHLMLLFLWLLPEFLGVATTSGRVTRRAFATVQSLWSGWVRIGRGRFNNWFVEQSRQAQFTSDKQS
jgi:hypothetical protein